MWFENCWVAFKRMNPDVSRRFWIQLKRRLFKRNFSLLEMHILLTISGEFSFAKRALYFGWIKMSPDSIGIELKMQLSYRDSHFPCFMSYLRNISSFENRYAYSSHKRIWQLYNSVSNEFYFEIANLPINIYPDFKQEFLVIKIGCAQNINNVLNFNCYQ